MTFRLSFVTGATPDKWAGAWRQRRRESLELIPIEEAVQTDGLLAGELDMALVRGRVDKDALGLHLIPLYDEVPVVVLGVDHVLTVLDSVSTADLAQEQPDWPRMWDGVNLRDAVATVAAGTGVLVVPMSIARLHHRRDLTTRVVTDQPSTSIGLAWRRDHDDERTQAFVGIVRGRTERSSRG